MKCHWKRIALFLAAALAIALVLFAPSSRQQMEPLSTQPSLKLAPTLATNEVVVEIVSPNGKSRMSLPCQNGETCGYTALSALQKRAAQDTMIVETKAYDGLGTMVTSIAGVANGQDGKYWVFEVNNQVVPIAADAYNLRAGDLLTWKFVLPE